MLTLDFDEMSNELLRDVAASQLVLEAARGENIQAKAARLIDLFLGSETDVFRAFAEALILSDEPALLN